VKLLFGEFVFDGGRRQLLRSGTAVALAPRPFELLELLLARRPEAVAKDEILDVVWKGAAVSETALTTAVGELRQALGESADRPIHLRTVHRFGYAFQSEATEVAAESRAVRARLLSAELRIDLHDGELVLGRHGGPSGDVADPSVSRHHARVHVSARGVEVEDLESKNGTWVNGARVARRQPVRDGDELRLGTFALVVREVPADREAETRTAIQEGEMTSRLRAPRPSRRPVRRDRR
jgi:DNA-binding winged helix-turn-helix (wHTH) protein